MCRYGFLARQVLKHKRLLLCGTQLGEVLKNLLYVLNLLSQHDPLQLFFYREAQPMQGFNIQELLEAPNPCVILCDYDVLSHRQFIWLLSVPSCTIIVLTDLFWNSVPRLFLNSCSCVLQVFQGLSLFLNCGDNKSCLALQLHSPVPLDRVTRRVVVAQHRFRERLQNIVLLQRYIKSWLYRPGFRLAVAAVTRCQNVV